MKPWTLNLWGILMRGKDGRDTLIGRMWHDAKPAPYDGEPRRALLFCTRKAARDWCAKEHAKCADRMDCCSDWRFRPVRVCETVRIRRGCASHDQCAQEGGEGR